MTRGLLEGKERNGEGVIGGEATNQGRTRATETRGRVAPGTGTTRHATCTD